MNTPDFTTTLWLNHTQQQAFDAINNVRGWWSENIEGETDKLNAQFLYQYKDVHYSKMKIIEFEPGKKVVWLAVDNYFKFTNDKSEWKGTKVVFEILEKDGQTAVRFTHEGLVPQYECYDVCRKAWTHYVQDSLRSLITTGKGQPNAKEEGRLNKELDGH